MTKQDQANAEKAAQWYLAGEGYKQQRKAVRTKYQKVDFFGADIMAMNKYGGLAFVQVTTGGYEAQRQRKRKLEKYNWADVQVDLFVMKKRKEGRSYRYWFEVFPYFYSVPDINYIWGDPTTIVIPREWFKKYEG